MFWEWLIYQGFNFLVNGRIEVVFTWSIGK